MPWPDSNAIRGSDAGFGLRCGVHDGIEVMANLAISTSRMSALSRGGLDGNGITPVFPLWGREGTRRWVHEMLEGGIAGADTCIDQARLHDILRRDVVSG